MFPKLLAKTLLFHERAEKWSVDLRKQMVWSVPELERLFDEGKAGIYWKIEVKSGKCTVHYKSRQTTEKGYWETNMFTLLKWMHHLCQTRSSEFARILGAAKTAKNATATGRFESHRQWRAHEETEGVIHGVSTKHALSYIPPGLEYKPILTMDSKSMLISSILANGSGAINEQRFESLRLAPEFRTATDALYSGGSDAQRSEWLAFVFGPRSLLFQGNTRKFRGVCEVFQNDDSKILPFDYRKPQAVFRGVPHGLVQKNFTNMPRTHVVALSVRRPDLVDARYIDGNVRGNSIKSRGETLPDAYWTKESMDETTQMAYRFVVVADGTSKPDRLARQMLYGSVVIKEVSAAMEQWYYDLVPFVHFLPFEKASDLEAALGGLESDAQTNDTLRSIAFEGMRYILTRYNLKRFEDEAMDVMAMYCTHYPQMCAAFTQEKAEELEYQQFATEKKHVVVTESNLCPAMEVAATDALAKQIIGRVFSEEQLRDLQRVSNERLWRSHALMRETVTERVHLLYRGLTPARLAWFREVVALRVVDELWSNGAVQKSANQSSALLQLTSATLPELRFRESVVGMSIAIQMALAFLCLFVFFQRIARRKNCTSQ